MLAIDCKPVALGGFLNNPDCLMTTSWLPKASLPLLINGGQLCDFDIRDFKHGRLQTCFFWTLLLVGPTRKQFGIVSGIFMILS